MKNWFLTTLAVATLTCSGVQAADNSTQASADGAKVQQTKQHTGAQVKAAHHHHAKHHRHNHVHEYCNGTCCVHSPCGHHHHVERHHHHKNKQGYHQHHNRAYSNDYGYYNNSNPQDAVDNPEKTNR